MHKFYKFISVALRYLFLILIIYFLFKKEWISKEMLSSIIASPRTSLFGLAFILTASFFSSLRWYSLVRSFGPSLRFFLVLKAHLIGNFFNMALPGAVSGDILKVLYLHQRSGGSRVDFFTSTVVDRFMGVFVLVLISTFSLFFGSAFAHPGASAKLMNLILILNSFFFLLIFILYFSSEEKILFVRVATLECWCAHRKFLTRPLGIFKKLISAITRYRNAPRVLLTALFWSILAQLLNLTGLVWIAKIFDPNFFAHGKSAIFGVAPIGLLVSAVPILPGGVGTGHGAFKWLYQQIGTDCGLASFNFYLLAQVTIAILGALTLLLSKGSLFSFRHPSGNDAENENRPKP